jgi:hypothetical protein
VMLWTLSRSTSFLRFVADHNGLVPVCPDLVGPAGQAGDLQPPRPPSTLPLSGPPLATILTRKQAKRRMAQVDEDEELAHLESSMSRPIEALAEEVLQLPSDARSRLLDRVVASLDTDRERDAAWDALAAHRDAEIESGAAIAASGPEVVARLRTELE